MFNDVYEVNISSILNKTIIIYDFVTIPRKAQRDFTIMSVKLNATGERLNVRTESGNVTRKLKKVKEDLPVITSVYPTRYGLRFSPIVRVTIGKFV